MTTPDDVPEIEPCDECGRGFIVAELWPVRLADGESRLMCDRCVDELRDFGGSA